LTAKRRGQPIRCLVAAASIWLMAGVAAVVAQPADDAEREELRAFLADTIASADSFDDRYDAEVWLVDMSARLTRYVDDPAQRISLLKDIHREATRAGVSPELVLSVIEVESHFKRFAVSRVGAQGMMQVMPFWKNEIGRPDDNLTQIDTNLEYGCRILQFYIDKKDGNLHRALAAYNGSTGSRVYSDKVYRVRMNLWRTVNLDWSY
jgi:soluble lytic murein transglycosylase-like protein